MAHPLLQLSLFTGTKFQTEHPIVGNATTNGLAVPVYTAGYYKNSFSQYFSHTPVAGTGITQATHVYPQEGCIEFWFKFDASYTGTTWSDAIPRTIFGASTIANPYIRMIFNNGLGILYDMRFAGGSNVRMTVTSVAPLVGEWHHYGLNWNTNNNTQELYYDGVLKGSGTGTITPSVLNKAFYMGAYSSTHTSLGAGGNMDGLAYHAFQKKDFTDRFKRRRGLNDKVE